MTQSGKVGGAVRPRRGVPGRSVPQPSAGAVGDDRIRELAALWESLLEAGPVGPDDSFFDLGGDSLLVMRMLWEVSRRFNVNVSPVEFFIDPTLRGLAQRLAEGDQGDPSTQSDVLLPQRTTGDLPPLFFLAGGSGGPDVFEFVYKRFIRWLPEGRPVYGLVPSTLDNAKDSFEMDRLTERYVDAIQNVDPVGPYYLAGECIGALVAFNVACRLEQEGSTVAQLALLDPPRPVPSAERTLGVHRLHKWLRRRRSRLKLFIGRTGHHLRVLCHVPLKQWPDYLRRCVNSAVELQAMQRHTGAEASRKLRYQQAVLRFRPASVFQGGLSLIYPAAGDSSQHEPGWRALASGDVAVHVVEGDHHTYIRGDTARGTAAYLARCLDEPRRSRP